MDTQNYELLDFFADWCGPCHAMKPSLEKIENDYKGKLSIRKIDVDQNDQLAAQYGVMGIPTFVIQKDGKEVSRKSGAMPYEMFKSWIDSVIKA